MLGKLARLLTQCLSLIVGGCVADQTATPRTIRVVLLGDEARMTVLEAIAADHRTNTSSNNAHVAMECSMGNSTLLFSTPIAESNDAGSLLDNADCAIIVIDVAQYNPELFESCAKLLSKNSSRKIILLFANTGVLRVDKPNAIELLELAELDCREFLNHHGLDGDNAAWFYDSQNVIPADRPPMGTTLMSLVKHIAK